MIGDKEHFHTKAKDILKHLSELTSKMSVLLIEAKESKKKLSNEEKKDYLMIAKLTETLGNLQYKLNQLIKNMNVSDDEKEVFTTETLAMMDSITDAQEQFRKVRVEINDFGIMSNNPDIATAFDYEEK
jgi:dimeric dUTPase (all-alpha-NTP-PPase superfamily)